MSTIESSDLCYVVYRTPTWVLSCHAGHDRRCCFRASYPDDAVVLDDLDALVYLAEDASISADYAADLVRMARDWWEHHEWDQPACSAVAPDASPDTSVAGQS